MVPNSANFVALSGATIDFGAGAVSAQIADTASGDLAGLTISGLQAGDVVDLTNVPFAAGATASVSGSSIVLSEGGTTYRLGVGTPNVVSAYKLIVTGDGQSGTDVTVALGSQLRVSGVHTIAAGHVEVGDIVLSGGSLVVAAGGFAVATTVSSGGSMTVSAGGQDQLTSLGGSETIRGLDLGNTILFGGVAVVSAGGTAAGTVFQSGAELIVSSGGFNTATSFGNGGLEIVKAGGRAFGVIVTSGGTLEFSGQRREHQQRHQQHEAVQRCDRHRDFRRPRQRLHRQRRHRRGFGGRYCQRPRSEVRRARGNLLRRDGYQRRVPAGRRRSCPFRRYRHRHCGRFRRPRDYQFRRCRRCRNAHGRRRLDPADLGTEVVSSGGVVSNVFIGSGGLLVVSSGGLALSATVESTGFGLSANGGVFVFGAASGTVVSSGGQYVVFSGGTDVGGTVDATERSSSSPAPPPSARPSRAAAPRSFISAIRSPGFLPAAERLIDLNVQSGRPGERLFGRADDLGDRRGRGSPAMPSSAPRTCGAAASLPAPSLHPAVG